MTEDEGAKFLARDFNQCFAQVRHYDSQIWAVFRFAFTAYTIILGTVIGVYQYSIDKSLNLIPAATCVLGVGLGLGLMIYSLVIRNRVYYVLVCRYINEHRRLFLEAKPLGFQNTSGMYINPTLPPYFNWRSWQSWLYYTIALLNALLAALLVFFALDGSPRRWALTIASGALTVLLQLGLGIAYLRSRDRKKGDDIVFGER